MEEKIGIVKAIMPPRGVWSSFTLKDWKQEGSEKDIFMSTKKDLVKDLGIEKGDEVKITYTTMENGQYLNYYLSKCEVLKKKPVGSTNTNNQYNPDIRVNVDAGNCVANAKDLLVALVNSGKVTTEEARKILPSLVEDFVKEFGIAKDLLQGKMAKVESTEEPKPEEVQEEIPVVRPGEQPSQ